MFAGDLGAGAALGFIGEVDILELGGIPALVDALLQLGRHLALFGDGAHNGLLALLYLKQLFVTVADGGYLNLVESTGALLAIAGDEGDGTTLVYQSQGGSHILLREAELGGNKTGKNVLLHKYKQ